MECMIKVVEEECGKEIASELRTLGTELLEQAGCQSSQIN